MLKKLFGQSKKRVIAQVVTLLMVLSLMLVPLTAFAYSGTAPVPPTTGTFDSGVYRNVFVEGGVADASQVSSRLSSLWTAFMNNRYKTVGTDMAYVNDGSGYALSEGQSYGMMIAVQHNKKAEFDKLWKWARTYMYQSSGEFKGYFAWKVTGNGVKAYQNPAPDGEVYFATALFMAAARWGNGTGISDYQTEADAILNAMIHQADDGVGVNMIDQTEMQIIFNPLDGPNFTDPSYHVAAFFDYFAQYAAADKNIWSAVATKSRNMWLEFSNSYGLSTNLAYFDGSPYPNFGADSDKYAADAWRTIMNASVDYAWWAKNTSAITYANNLSNYFAWKMNQGDPYVGAYYGKLDIYGNTFESYENAAAYACHGVAALAADSGSYTNGWKMLQRFWDTAIPTGYYDQLIYHLAFLHSSGNFKIYKLGTSSSINPYASMEAENYNSQSGIQTEACSEGGENIGYIQNNDYIVFTDVNFETGATGFQARVASNASGGNIEIRLGSPTGKLVGTCSVTGTGGWQTWMVKTCSVSGATGTQDLYLTFTGGNGYLFNVNWIKFTQ